MQGASASDDEIVLLQAVSKIVSEFIQYKEQWLFIQYMLFTNASDDEIALLT